MRTDQGLTLIEVLAAIVLLSALAAAVTPLLRDAVRAHGSVRAEAAACVESFATAASEEEQNPGAQVGEPLVLVHGDALQGTWHVVIRNGVAVCRWFPEEAGRKPSGGRRR